MKIMQRLSGSFSAAAFAVAAVMFLPLGLGVSLSSNAVAAVLPDFTDLVDKVGPAVVNIRTTERSKGGMPQGQGAPGSEDEEMQEFFRRFFGQPPGGGGQRPQPSPRGRKGPQGGDEQSPTPKGVGSGFIISADGFVLTNAHVVEGSDEVFVTLTDKREFKAKIIGSDRRTDVALVKIDGTNLPRLTMGDSSKIRVGEWVIAIGSPFGLENTVTAGIISANSRDTGDYLPLIQTDVAVNPGNSGGPLINMRGEVIGINSQIYSRSGGYMGISFAVPIDEAMRVSDQLKSMGRVVRGRIGVQIGEVTKDVAESLGLPRPQGALVARVEPGSPAEKAGVEAGDIITNFNGTTIEKSGDLPRLVGNTKPGSKATLTVLRKGNKRDLPVVIAEMEVEQVAKKEEKKPKQEQALNSLGLAVNDLTEGQRRELKLEGGVIVELADGSAARAGIQPGDVIVRLNNTDIKDTKQFNALVAKLDPKKNALLLVRRGDASQFVPLRPAQP
jgi:serine protease Do